MVPVTSRIVPLLLAAACARQDAPPTDTARSASPPSTSAAPAASDSAPRPGTRWQVTPRGIGPVLAGLPLAALDRALSERLRPTYAAGSSCGYLRPAALPEGVLVMVLHDTVARVDVRSRGVLTADGAGVGDSEASVLRRYAGRVRVTAHKYTGPTGHYLTVASPLDTAHLLVFETDGKSVVSYRAGRRPAVELVEGCS